MPPTPQASQSFSHPTAASPNGPNMNGLPSYNHSYSMSFDSQQGQSQPQHHPVQGYSQSFPNGPVSNPGYARSFNDGSFGANMRTQYEKPQIYTAVYSGVQVYEMEIQGVACMRRRTDGWLNATQILKVAGVDKGKRTKVLEKEILTGEHEKVQGGYGKYQGTWISYRRGREFCRQYGVEDILKPLLDYDVSADGAGGQGQDTPTKEQAMAANRKRFYNSSLDGRPNGGAMTNGTFFQNISPTTSVALAAMNKAARLNSPAPRPPSAQKATTAVRRPSHQENYPGGSQQSLHSEGSFNADSKFDSVYGTQPNGGHRADNANEPPRKRMRPSSLDGVAEPTLAMDASMRPATPTEPNESFVYDGTASQEYYSNSSGDPVALPPLPAPTSDEQESKKNLLLNLFADNGRVDYANHPALTQLAAEDLNLPLDTSANTALHWSATLARVPLLKLLIRKGASIWRGNAAGQSPLVSAVLVNNCWEHSNFPDLLELLGPLIEVRDLQGRTILHHIAVSSGIKGRAPSSKYYLEALLEFLVRSVSHPGLASAAAPGITASQRTNGDVSSQESGASLMQTLQSSKGPMSLMRFLSHIVNARDKAGNTALNLVARIGNRSIIHQLLEIQADPGLPNYKGVSAKDFGVGIEPGEQYHANGLTSQHSILASQEDGQAVTANGNMAEDLIQDVLTSMTSMLTQNMTQHRDLLKLRTEQIDRLNQQIRDFSALQKQDLDQLQALQRRLKMRTERQQKIANLKRAVQERKPLKFTSSSLTLLGQADDPLLAEHDPEDASLPDASSEDSPLSSQQRQYASSLPSLPELRTRLNAYMSNNQQLGSQAAELKDRSGELEALYRKVVSLCTNVPEDKVAENLASLVAAVESERGGLGREEVGRVREFLMKVDGVTGVEA